MITVVSAVTARSHKHSAISIFAISVDLTVGIIIAVTIIIIISTTVINSMIIFREHRHH